MEVILTQLGKVYSFRHGYNGQLGQGTNFNCLVPKEIKNFNKVKINEIACGWSHTVILSNKGYVYTAGCNLFGKLGVCDKVNRDVFVLVKDLVKYSSRICGWTSFVGCFG